jgi:hypothetical protein
MKNELGKPKTIREPENCRRLIHDMRGQKLRQRGRAEKCEI